MIDVRVAMQRRGRDAQALKAARHCGIVDRLNVNPALLHQQVADEFALDGVAHHHGDDVAGIVQMGNPQAIKPLAHTLHTVAMALALGVRRLEVTHRLAGASRQRRRDRGGENEAGGEAAHIVAQRLGSGDVAAHDAVGLGERALDHREAMAKILALGDAAAARAVHAHGMNLVQIRHGVVTLGDVTDFRNRRDVAVHGVHGLEHDDLRARGIEVAQLALEVGRIIVTEDALFDAGVTHALDH